MMIQGPDPALLDDGDLLYVANALYEHAARIVDVPAGAGISNADVERLPPAPRYLFRSMHVQFQILAAELRRRDMETATLIAEVERFLTEGS